MQFVSLSDVWLLRHTPAAISTDALRFALRCVATSTASGAATICALQSIMYSYYDPRLTQLPLFVMYGYLNRRDFELVCSN